MKCLRTKSSSTPVKNTSINVDRWRTYAAQTGYNYFNEPAMSLIVFYVLQRNMNGIRFLLLNHQIWYHIHIFLVDFSSQLIRSKSETCLYVTLDHRTILYRKEARIITKRARALCFDFPFVRRGLRDSRSKRCDTTWVLRECLDNNGYRRVFLMKYRTF